MPVEQLSLAEDPSDVHRRRRRDGRIAGGVIGGALLAGGAVSFGLAWQAREGLDETVPRTSVQPVQRGANTLGTVSYALAGAGALALTLGVAVPW